MAKRKQPATLNSSIRQFLADVKAYEIANQDCIIHGNVFNFANDPERLAERGERADDDQLAADAERQVLTPRRKRAGTHWALLASGKRVAELLLGNGPAKLLARFLYFMDLPHADPKSGMECWPDLFSELKVMLTATGAEVTKPAHSTATTIDRDLQWLAEFEQAGHGNAAAFAREKETEPPAMRAALKRARAQAKSKRKSPRRS